MEDKKIILEKIIAFTDFVSQFTTICVAIACVLVLIVLTIKVMLIIEQTSFLLISLALFISSSVVFSPVLENIIDAIVNIKHNNTLNKLVVILRNLVATAAGGLMIYKLMMFSQSEDFHKFESIKDVIQELVSFLFS